MNKNRLEAFSDGVLAIIITIMVLELKPPPGGSIADLRPLVPAFFSYLLSFLYVGIYWNNHHHLLHTAKHVTGRMLWANLHLLFWLSLLPAVTAWLGAHPFASWPAALYGCVLFASALAWRFLKHTIMATGGPLAQLVGVDWKGKLSMLTYAVGAGLAFVHPFIADGCYAIVAAIWFVPDRRIERGVSSAHE